jgi:hypothetical protein
VRILSSACQIVNEKLMKLMKCVQPAQGAELMPFMLLFFKSSLESHHADMNALECIKNQNT